MIIKLKIYMLEDFKNNNMKYKITKNKIYKNI